MRCSEFLSTDKFTQAELGLFGFENGGDLFSFRESALTPIIVSSSANAVRTRETFVMEQAMRIQSDLY